MLLNKEILGRLEKFLEENNLSRKQFALSIGAQPSGISEIFNGNISSLSGTTVRIIEVIYGINPKWLETGFGKKFKSTVTITDENECDMIIKTRKLNKENKILLKALIETLWITQSQEIEKKKKKKSTPKSAKNRKTKK